MVSQIDQYLKQAIVAYTAEFSVEIQREVITDILFGNGAWTKWYRFVFTEPTTEEDFMAFLVKEGLWFVPQEGETLEIKSMDGGTVWTYYAEKGQLPE